MKLLKPIMALCTVSALMFSPMAVAQKAKTCNDKLSGWEIERAKIDAHALKYEVLGRGADISKYELCKCTDKTIVVRLKGGKGNSLETGEVVK